MKLLAILASLVISSCYMEWDVPKTPRRDPCTQQVEDRTVYVEPVCHNPSPRNPRDLDYADPASLIEQSR